jgi:uridine kinase
VVIPWDRAPAEILARAAASPPAGVRVVGITGPVGAGKSALAARLSACVLSTDDYLPDYDRVPFRERDDPRHADFDLLAAHLACLRRGEPASVPVWSYQSHRREGTRIISPAPVVVVEGIHALYQATRELLDVKVFVEAPPEVRWERWEHLEQTGQRGWGVEAAREFFEQVAEPTFAAFEPEYRLAADCVVSNSHGVPGR